MKNTLSDLNNHLFAQLERLSDEDLNGEELEKEIGRSQAIAKVSEQIIKNGELQYKVIKHMDEHGYNHDKQIPATLIGGGSGVRNGLSKKVG